MSARSWVAVVLLASVSAPGLAADDAWTTIFVAADGSNYSYRADRVEYNTLSKRATVWYRYWSLKQGELTFPKGVKIKYRYTVSRLQIPCDHSQVIPEQINYYDNNGTSVYLQPYGQAFIPEPDSVLDKLTTIVCPT